MAKEANAHRERETMRNVLQKKTGWSHADLYMLSGEKLRQLIRNTKA